VPGMAKASISPEAPAHPFAPSPRPADPAAVELGLAIGARLADCEQLTLELAARGGERVTLSRDLQDRRQTTRQVATLLIARWLVTGESASEDEARWISEQGELAARVGVSIAEMARGYLRWRDALTAILGQEAKRLGTPEAVADGDRRVVAASCDASLTRMAKAYDRQARQATAGIEAQSQRFRALHELAVSAGGILDAGTLAATAVDGVRSLLACSGASFASWNPATRKLEVLAEQDDADGAAGRLRRAVMAKAISSRGPARRRGGGVTVLAVPLVVHGRAIAAVSVTLGAGDDQDPEIDQVLSLVAAQVAPAFEAARLHSELAGSELSFRVLYGAMACGVMVLSPAGEVLEANDAAARILNLSLSELIGSNAVAPNGGMLQADGLPLSESPSAAAIRTRRPVTGVICRLLPPGAQPMWLQVESVPVRDRDGELVQVVTTFIDISGFKQAEEAQLESEAKSRFLASMSHELRTPLNSILGFAQLLEMEGAGSLTDRQERHVARIQSSGRHLLALIEDILDLSKVAAGKLDLDTERVTLRPLVQEVAGTLLPAARAKGLTLVVDLPPRLAASGDRLRIRQVALNLVANAIKFTDSGGVTITAGREGRTVQLVVSDTGIGIAAEHMERAFDEFAQIDSGRKRSREGTGLGLPLSRRLCELMGGSLALESEVGVGTRAIATLPAG